MIPFFFFPLHFFQFLILVFYALLLLQGFCLLAYFVKCFSCFFLLVCFFGSSLSFLVTILDIFRFNLRFPLSLQVLSSSDFGVTWLTLKMKLLWIIFGFQYFLQTVFIFFPLTSVCSNMPPSVSVLRTKHLQKTLTKCSVLRKPVGACLLI